MNKKYLFSAVAFSAFATISYQTWKVINKPVVENISQVTPVSKIEEVAQVEGIEKIMVGTTKEYTVNTDNNSITVNVGLEGKNIVSLDISHYDDSPTSKMKHDLFDKNLDKGAILGKDITALEISTVTGATMTTGAFKEAIKDIITQLGS